MSTLAKHPRATMLSIYSLGVFMGLLHVYFGLVSLTPTISQDYHREMKINYNAFAKTLTFLHQFVDRVVLALYLRYFFSIVQIVFGSFLVGCGRFGQLDKAGNLVLIGVNTLCIIFKFLVGTSLDRLAPTVVFTVLLVARALIIEQGSKRPRAGAKTRNAGKPKTSTPKKNKNE